MEEGSGTLALPFFPVLFPGPCEVSSFAPSCASAMMTPSAAVPKTPEPTSHALKLQNQERRQTFLLGGFSQEFCPRDSTDHTTSCNRTIFPQQLESVSPNSGEKSFFFPACMFNCRKELENSQLEYSHSIGSLCPLVGPLLQSVLGD